MTTHRMVKTNIRANRIVVAVVVALCAGCGADEFTVAPVSGTVTLDGVPLPNAHIGFEPMAAAGTTKAGPGSYATTDANGHYALQALDKRRGAVVGMHRVAIRTFKAERGPNGEMKVIRQETLPDRYHVSTELTFDVPKGGSDSADFLLTTN